MTALEHIFRTRGLLAKGDFSAALTASREGLVDYPDETKLLRLCLFCRLKIEGAGEVLKDTEARIDGETGERLTKWLIAREKAGAVSSGEEEAWAESLLSIFDDTATWKK
jgi:hypothetical protein